MYKVETRKSTRVVSSKKVRDQINKILSVDSDEALGLWSVDFGEVMGRGVVSDHDIAKGDHVVEYTGEVISKGMV